MIVWWNESGEILACHKNRGGFEVAPPEFAGSLEIPDDLGELVGALPLFHRFADGVLQVTEDDGQSWADVEIPPFPVPATITRWQGRKWLLQEELLASVEAMIAAAGLAAQIDYEAPTWYRDSPLIAQLGAALGKTSGGIDDFVREAAAFA